MTEFRTEFTNPTFANYNLANADTTKLKDMWEQYNGIYGAYKVTNDWWTRIGTMELVENIYNPDDGVRYLHVKWTNLKTSNNADDQGRATLFLMLDTSYMSASMLNYAQKYNAWNPNAA